MRSAPKKKGNVSQRVWEMCGPLAQELGLSLWDVQFVKEGADWFLRVFIDKEGGVSIDDCVDMTHALSPVLDREDPIPQEYLLEVSSPGLERRLTRPEHFAAYVGRPVRARLIRPLENGQRELCGILLRAEEDGQLEIQLDEETSVTVEKITPKQSTAAPLRKKLPAGLFLLSLLGQLHHLFPGRLLLFPAWFPLGERLQPHSVVPALFKQRKIVGRRRISGHSVLLSCKLKEWAFTPPAGAFQSPAAGRCAPVGFLPPQPLRGPALFCKQAFPGAFAHRHTRGNPWGRCTPDTNRASAA